MGAVFDLNAIWTNPQNAHDQIIKMQVLREIFLTLFLHLGF